LKAPAKINRALLQEFVKKGQRVEAFTLEAWSGEDNAKGEWKPMAAGKTIGGKRLLRFPDTKTSRVRLTITESRGECMISKIGLFHDGHN
jgi:alpha-L-fucosidase